MAAFIGRLKVRTRWVGWSWTPVRWRLTTDGAPLVKFSTTLPAPAARAVTGVGADEAVGRGGDAGLAVGADGRGVAGEAGGGAGRRRGEGDPAARDRLAEGAGDGDDQGRGEGGAEPSGLVVAAHDGEGEAARLEGADVGGGSLGPGDAPLVGGHAGDGDAGVDGRAAGEQGLGEGGPAVVGQRAEQRVGVDAGRWDRG